jgi:hypothetical protein
MMLDFAAKGNKRARRTFILCRKENYNDEKYEIKTSVDVCLDTGGHAGVV